MADLEKHKTESQKATEFVMRAAGQTVNDRPTVPSEDDRILRAKLLFEECLETIDALGVNVLDFTYNKLDAKDPDVTFAARDSSEVDLLETIDGCVDVMVIAVGTLSTIGVPALPFIREVDRANVRKVGPDGKIPRRDDGKFLKPKGWTGPDHARVASEVFQ